MSTRRSSPGTRSEANIESCSFQCETRVCIVNHFRGRVSCPYGQKAGVVTDHGCHVPGETTPIASDVIVAPQCIQRALAQEVYCSCRCVGTDLNGCYCKCPNGFT